jgi:hypothetical protein
MHGKLSITEVLSWSIWYVQDLYTLNSIVAVPFIVCSCSSVSQLLTGLEHPQLWHVLETEWWLGSSFLWQPTLEVCSVHYWPRFELVLLSEQLSLDGTHPMLPWEQGISALKLKWACHAFFPDLFSAITALWLPCKEYPSVSTFVSEIVNLVTDSYWSLNFLIQDSAAQKCEDLDVGFWRSPIWYVCALHFDLHS